MKKMNKNLLIKIRSPRKKKEGRQEATPNHIGNCLHLNPNLHSHFKTSIAFRSGNSYLLELQNVAPTMHLPCQVGRHVLRSEKNRSTGLLEYKYREIFALVVELFLLCSVNINSKLSSQGQKHFAGEITVLPVDAV